MSALLIALDILSWCWPFPLVMLSGWLGERSVKL